MIKKLKKQKKPHLKLILIIILIFSLILFFNNKVKPTIYKKCIFEMNRFATNKISQAIKDAVEKYGYNYDDYVNIKTTEQGNILAIYTNSKQITKIHNEINDNVTAELNKFKNYKIEICLGNLTGIFLFASKGPRIPIKIDSKGIINSEIISCLEEAGINQTLHKLHIKLSANMIAFLPFHSEETTVNSRYMLSESIIVGQVPKHYTKILSSDKKNENLNNAYKFVD